MTPIVSKWEHLRKLLDCGGNNHQGDKTNSRMGEILDNYALTIYIQLNTPSLSYNLLICKCTEQLNKQFTNKKTQMPKYIGNFLFPYSAGFCNSQTCLHCQNQCVMSLFSILSLAVVTCVLDEIYSYWSEMEP